MGRQVVPLLIGCPVANRGWMAEAWFNHTEAACLNLGVEPHYLFVVDAEDESAKLWSDTASGWGRTVGVKLIEDKHYPKDHAWNKERYHHMVWLRNQLLDAVRDIEPNYFLRLDSDIMVHHTSLSSLMELTSKFDAVGGKVHLSHSGTNWPSFAMMPRNRLRRWDSTQVLEVDAIMAMKLMSPYAYHVDYEFHEQGEDLGWSAACRRKGLKLGWDGRVTNKHVMLPKQLLTLDKRCGY